ncbi:hypothetical protein K431DRAFT_281743 [Polychaeton citri CBS 116435]|uniref:RING-type domain-containing protein n=1 Tax=Polychaeton citri CBS 116435 TaxID=1314669 RepID=A0A9P4QHD1_9PEZI|nr:hypothetical protein K431DRAFT_281743 [Polychaeton citri CBS 116435]
MSSLLEDSDLLLALPAFVVSLLVHERLYFVAAALAISLVAWRFWIPQAEPASASSQTAVKGKQHTSKPKNKSLLSWDAFVWQFRKPAEGVRSSERCISCWTDDSDADFQETANTFLANSRIHLPYCGHTLCLACSRNWFTIHQQTVCPLCQQQVLRNGREVRDSNTYETIENVAVCCQVVVGLFVPLELAANLYVRNWTMACVNVGGLVAAVTSLVSCRRLMQWHGSGWWRQSPAAKTGRWSNLGYWVLHAAWTIFQVQCAYNAWLKADNGLEQQSS